MTITIHDPHKAGPGRHRSPELAEPEHPSRAHHALVEALGWAILATIAFTLVGFVGTDEQRWSSGLLGGLCWLLGTRVFLGHGGPLLTPQSIFGFAFAIFFGIGGVYHAVLAPSEAQPWLRLSLLLALLAQVGIHFGFWYRRRPTSGGQLPTGLLSGTSGTVLAVLGAAAFLGAVLWRFRSAGDPSFTSLALGTAFSGVTLTTAALVLHERARLLSLRSVVVLAMLAMFIRYVHGGTGRLLIVALGFAIAIIYALRFRTMLIKVAVIVATAPVLWWMARDRLTLINDLSFGDSYGRTGLESAVRPPLGFAELLHAYRAGSFAPSGGSTFLSLPAMFVPDQFWDDRPIALGYELARITAPTKYGTGYSDASSVYGEWLFSFGYLGLLLMVPVIGLALPLLDRILARSLRARSDEARLLAVSAAIILCAGVPDLVWSGLHTYGVRSLLRLPLLLIPLLLIALLRPTYPAAPPRHATAGLPFRHPPTGGPLPRNTRSTWATSPRRRVRT